MLFDRSLQLDIEEYFMLKKNLSLTWNIYLSFCARSGCKNVTFCKIRRMSKGGFLNFGRG